MKHETIVKELLELIKEEKGTEGFEDGDLFLVEEGEDRCKVEFMLEEVKGDLRWFFVSKENNKAVLTQEEYERILSERKHDKEKEVYAVNPIKQEETTPEPIKPQETAQETKETAPEENNEPETIKAPETTQEAIKPQETAPHEEKYRIMDITQQMLLLTNDKEVLSKIKYAGVKSFKDRFDLEVDFEDLTLEKSNLRIPKIDGMVESIYDVKFLKAIIDQLDKLKHTKVIIRIKEDAPMELIGLSSGSVCDPIRVFVAPRNRNS